MRTRPRTPSRILRRGRPLASVLLALALTATACAGSETTGDDAPTPPGVDDSSPEGASDDPQGEEGTAPLTPFTAPVVATLLDQEPIVGPADGEKWTNPGWMIVHGGTLHMFRNSFSAWPGDSVTHLLTSTDGGATWTERPDPVWTNEDVPFGDGGNAFFMTGHVADDGTWSAYYYVYNGPTSRGEIGRATAPAPAGPWTSDPQPAIEPGPDGTWDEVNVGEPEVAVTEAGWFLWYSGRGDDGTTSIGLATSEDGVMWTKHDDPMTTEAPFAESDPVLTGDEVWDGGSVGCPQVLVADDGSFVMQFDSATRGTHALGVAVSGGIVAGVEWSKAALNPIVTTELSPNRAPTWQSALVGDADAPTLFLEIGAASTGTAVHRLDLDLSTVWDVDPTVPRISGTSVEVAGDDVTIVVDTQGWEPAFSAGDASTWHVHAYVDLVPPRRSGIEIPLGRDGIIHSTGATLRIDDLEPGDHTIWIVVADGNDLLLEFPRPVRVDVTIDG